MVSAAYRSWPVDAFCWAKSSATESFSVYWSLVERKTPGSEMLKSPGQISLSRFAPSTSAEVPFVSVEFEYLKRWVSGQQTSQKWVKNAAYQKLGMLESLAAKSTSELPDVAGIVQSWSVYAAAYQTRFNCSLLQWK